MKRQLDHLLPDVLLVAIFSVVQVQAQFKLQYIGNQIDDDGLLKRDYCTTKQCLVDSQILFLAASQNESVTPCEDFREFALGDFIKHSALNERYQFIGLQNDIDEIYKEKFRKVLTSKLQSNQSRTFGIIKSYFSKCTNSRHDVKQAASGMINLLKEHGGSPFLSRGDAKWDVTKFSLKKLFLLEPNDAMSMFLDHKLDRCRSPLNSSEQVLCFKTDYSWVNTNSSQIDISELLLDFTNSYLVGETKRNVLRVHINMAVKRLSEFNNLKEECRKSLNEVDTPRLMTIKQLSNFMPALRLNWLEIINQQLLKTSKVTSEDYVLVESPELLKELSKVIASCSSETLAEAFTMSFVYLHQWVFNVYPFDERRAANRGTSKAFQRWETCLKEITYRMRPSSEVLFSRHLFDSKVQAKVESLVNNAVGTCIQTIKEKSNLSPDILEYLTAKLGSLKIVAGVNEAFLNYETLENFYEELDLKSGEEDYVITWIRILRFHQKILNEDKKKWQRVLDVFLHNEYIEYDVDENILYIPWKWILYPWFHVSRPYFFNVATLFTDVIETVNIALRDYLMKKHRLSFIILGLENADNLSYEYYSKWLSLGNKDLQLGANRLTNEQLFWVALARKFFVKYQPNIPKTFDPFGQLQNDFLHVIYKRQEGFQQAYGCSMSANDLKMEANYYKENKKLIQAN